MLLVGCIDGDQEESGSTIEELAGSNLAGVNLAGSNLAGTNLGGLNLAGTNLGGLNLAGTNLGGLNLAGNNLAGTNLAGNNLGGLNLAGANLGGLNLAGNNLGGLNLAGSNLASSNLSGSSVTGAYAGQPCPRSNTLAASLGTDLTASTLARNLHGGLQTGMLRSGEDTYTRSNACVVMGLGSPAFAKLVDAIRVSGDTSVNVAIRDLDWGFAETSGGPMVLRAWEAVVWGGTQYSVFVLAAPPSTEWSGVAGFVKAVWRWAGPTSMSVNIARIGGGVTAISYTGMMDAARQYVNGLIDERSYLAGLLTLTTATTNNIGVMVDFSSWTKKKDGTGLILGNVGTTNGPTYAEATYVAEQNPDGTVAIVIRPIDTWNRATLAPSGIASGLGDLETAYKAWVANPTLPKPIPLRCAGALLARTFDPTEPSWQYKCDSAVTFAGHGNTAPNLSCGGDCNTTDDTAGVGAWSSYAAGTSAPYNSYMTIQPSTGSYLRCTSSAMNQSSPDETCVSTARVPVLAETLVHTWTPAFDTTSIPVDIQAGIHYTIVRRGDGTLWSWGANWYGQSGRPITNGVKGEDLAPGQVVLADKVTPFTNVVELSVGGGGACARKGDGTVWCWGYGANGQLGTGVMMGSVNGAPVQSLVTGATQLAEGEYHACARISDGTVKCWGRNDTNQLGNGTSINNATPGTVMVNGSTALTGVTKVSSGSSTSCALKTDGTLWCWGFNSHGQVGNGNKANQSYAVQTSVTGATSVVVANEDACVIKAGGTVWCWGDNQFGSLGNGTTSDSLTAVQTRINGSSFLTNVDQLSSVGRGWCAHKTDGTAWCWGLGANTPNIAVYATQVAGLGNTVTRVTLGQVHACAIMSNYEVRCWGDNGDSHLGLPGATSSTPQQVTALGTTVAEVAATTGQHICARKTDGSVWCWGWGAGGKLGDNDTTGVTSSTPVRVKDSGSTFLSGVTQLRGNRDDGTCARKTDGTVWCWGTNGSFQYTDVPAVTYVATRLNAAAGTALTGIESISVGNYHMCAVKVVGAGKEAWCWGDNMYGQIGSGTGNAKYPVKVSTWTDVSAVATGDAVSCAMRTGGSVWCWGYGAYGRLGNGGTADSATPVQVKIDAATNLGGVIGLYAPANGGHVCAKKTDGTLWCWGYNALGQLGDGTTTNRTFAVQATAFGGSIADASLAVYSTCVRKTDNTAFCIGNNVNGQLGIGTTTSTITPAHIGDGVAQLSAALLNYCQLKTTGVLLCAGTGTLGQLADGRQTYWATPVLTIPW